MNDKNHKEWLASLKPGDKVAIPRKSMSSYSSYDISTVERLTNTQIIILGGNRYRKENGRPIGSVYGMRLQPYSDDVKADIALIKMVNGVRDGLDKATAKLRRGVDVSCMQELDALLSALNTFLEEKPSDASA